MKLKAYIVGERRHDDPFDNREMWGWCQVVAAVSPEVALSGRGWHVVRLEEADKYIEGPGTMYLTPAQLRDLGWGEADEEACHCCSLYANGMKEYRVCGECNHCPECRDAEDDCPECRP